MLLLTKEEERPIRIRAKELLLISHLRQNSRESLTKISRKTKVPVSTLFDKIKQYQDILIKKHTTILDFKKIGFRARANLMIKVRGDDKERIKEELKKCDNVNSLYKINNGYDFLAELIFRNMSELEDYIEMLEEKFQIVERRVHYIVEEIIKEEFLAKPQLIMLQINE